MTAQHWTSDSNAYRDTVKTRMSALGQKRTFAVQNVHVRFTPESGHLQAQVDVRFVPIADISQVSLFDP